MKINTLSVAALAISATLSANVFAVDAKTVAGAICQPSLDEYDISRNSSGYARNNSNSTQYWTCPIVRDMMNPNMNNARMKVKNATGTLSCTLHSRNANGGSVASVTRSTSLSGTSVQTLTWPSVADANDGYYYFRCTVTAGSEIRSYYWSENT